MLDKSLEYIEQIIRENPHIFSLHPPAEITEKLKPYLRVRRYLARRKALILADNWRRLLCPHCVKPQIHICDALWVKLVDNFEKIILDSEPELKTVEIYLSYELPK